MAKCDVIECKGVVVNGLKEMMDVSHSGYHILKGNGFSFYWCKDH